MYSVNKIVKMLSVLNTGGSLSMVNYELAKKMVDSVFLDWSDPTKKICDPCCGSGMFLLACAEKLQEYGHEPKHIVTKMLFGFDLDEVQIMTAKKALRMFCDVDSNIEKKDSLTVKNNFNTVLMNPPYSLGKKLLYKDFFKMALDMADEVHVVMPVNLESNSTMHGNVNDLIHKHKLAEPEYVGDYFPNVGLSNIHYVKASRHQNNPVPEKVNVLDSIPDLMPERDRLKPIIGGVGLDKDEVNPRGIDAIHKVFRNNEIIYKRVDKAVIDKCTKWSDAKWLVVASRVVGYTGRLNAAVVKNDPQITWSGWTAAFECDTKREAQELVNWLESDKIINQMQIMLEAKKTYTCSKDMLGRLPSNVG